MFKHDDIPEYMPPSLQIGSLYKATIKTRPSEATLLFAKGRVGQDASADIADRWFLATLLALYGGHPFKRGNLDAGRVNRFFGEEIVPADAQSFDAKSFDAELRIDLSKAASYINHLR